METIDIGVIRDKEGSLMRVFVVNMSCLYNAELSFYSTRMS